MSQASTKFSKANGFHEVSRLKNNPLWSGALPSRLTGVTASPPRVSKVVLPLQIHGLLHTWLSGVALPLRYWPSKLERVAQPFQTKGELALLPRTVVGVAALMISESPWVTFFPFLEK